MPLTFQVKMRRVDGAGCGRGNEVEAEVGGGDRRRRFRGGGERELVVRWGDGNGMFEKPCEGEHYYKFSILVFPPPQGRNWP